jgi:plasmid stabilization system protein ParE
MRYKVRLTYEVMQQVAAIGDYISQDSPRNARRWRHKIREHIRSLKKNPERHEIAFRAQDAGRDIRHTFYGVYRILYIHN